MASERNQAICRRQADPAHRPVCAGQIQQLVIRVAFVNPVIRS
jgi:hypothetical protein